MYSVVYSKIDAHLNIHILENLCEYFKESPEFEGVSPIILTSLLTDKEANEFAYLKINLQFE